jgi:hypothetical protein
VTACPAGASLRDDRFLVLTTGELQGIDADA